MVAESATSPPTAPLVGRDLNSAPNPAAALADQSRADFASVLGRKQVATLTPKEQAIEAAQQLVSVSLLQPVLKQLRESSHAAPPFAPNQAERTFRSMMDANFAQNMVKSGRWGLVDSVARKLLERTSPKDAAEFALNGGLRKDSAFIRE